MHRRAERGPHLLASGGCIDGRLVVINNESAHWTDVRAVVNEEFEPTVDGIMAGSRQPPMPQLFKDSAGRRLDLSRTACQTLAVRAFRNGKRGFWFGRYK